MLTGSFGDRTELILPEAAVVGTELFVQELNEVCGRFQLKTRANATEMLGLLSVRQTAGMDIACVGLNALQVDRNERDIRRDAGGYYFLILQQSGTADIYQNDSHGQLAPGDMIIVDADQPSTFRFENGYSAQVSVHLPRDEMTHRFGRRINGGIAIPRHDMLGAAMRCILSGLMMDEKPAEPHVREAFFALLGAFLTERSLGTLTINPDRVIVNRACTLINEHFQDAEFSTRALADLLNISLRRLQRAFKLVNETPRERLQAVRIEHAHQGIIRAGVEVTSPNISTIAYASGFNDLSTFYRCFRNRYHTSPREQVACAKCAVAS